MKKQELSAGAFMLVIIFTISTVCFYGWMNNRFSKPLHVKTVDTLYWHPIYSHSELLTLK